MERGFIYSNGKNKVGIAKCEENRWYTYEKPVLAIYGNYMMVIIGMCSLCGNIETTL